MNSNPIPLRSNRRQLFRLISFWIAIWMAISLACSMPWEPGGPTATPGLPQPTPLKPVTKPRPDMALPPTVVESQPLPESEVGPKTSFSFTFNQAMDTGSVQTALKLNPPVTGSFEWSAGNTVVTFKPDQALPLNADLSLTFTTAAKAVNGLTLQEPVEIPYHTTGNIEVTQVLPADGTKDIDPGSAIVVAFNRPIVALSAETANQPEGFSVEPKITGRGEWLNTSTYIFYPEPPMLGGTAYTVRINQDLKTPDELTFSPDSLQSWTFTTALPKVLSVMPVVDITIPLDQDFSVEFNQAMDTASVESGLSLTVGDARLPVQYSWSKDERTVTVKANDLLPRGISLTLKLAAGALSKGGAKIDSEVNSSFSTMPAMGVEFTNPSQGSQLELYSSRGTIQVHFTATLSHQDFTNLVSIEPGVQEFNVYSNGDRDLWISGNFQYRTNYTLRLAATIQDKWSDTLKEQYQLVFSTPGADPQLIIPIVQYGDSVVFLAPEQVKVPVQATNLQSLKISTKRLSLSEFLYLAPVPNDARKSSVGSGVISWTQALTQKPDTSEQVEVSLLQPGKTAQTGLYYYFVQSPQAPLKQSPYPFLGVVSHTQLTIKIFGNQAMVWAINLDTLQPVVGQPVKGLTWNEIVVGSGTTNDQGIAVFDLNRPKDTGDTVYFVLGNPDDPNFGLASESWSQGLEGWDFGINTDSTPDHPVLYMYTDRPIYRPGQTVYFRGVLRERDNGRFSLLDRSQLSFTIWGGYDVVKGERIKIATLDLPVSPYGSVNGSVVIPDTASPGDYQIEASDIQYSYLNFKVAEYRKPQVDLQLKFDQPDLQAGNDLKATLSAKYYFGAPAGDLNIHWSLIAYPTYFDIPGGYRTGKVDTQWMYPSWYGLGYNFGKFIVDATGKTSPDGTLEISIPAGVLADNLDLKNPQRLSIEATVQDSTELPVSTRSEVLMHPEAYYIGIRPETWSGQQGVELGFSIQTVDAKLGASGNHTLKAIFERVEWKQTGDYDPNLGELKWKQEVVVEGTTTFQVDASGRARVAFTPLNPGVYMLEITSNNAVSQVMTWVGGSGTAPWPSLPNQHLRLQADADSYQPGQTAKIFIPNPYSETAVALVTIERSKVMSQQIITINGPSYELALPVTDEMAPNVFVSVVILGRDQDGLPDFRIGYQELKISPTSEVLKVAIASQPERSEPGGDVTFSIKVTDSQDRPVEGEFSLALVDKAIFALADPNSDPIDKFFYGQNPLGVSNSMSLAVFGQRMVLTPLGRGGGGGGDQVIPITIRENFQDTALWNGTFTTNTDGVAQITTKLPDNVTTWVADVRGLTKDTKVGTTTLEVIATKDLLIRPVTPRFFVSGDHVALAATVNNNTLNSLTVEASLQPVGFDLDQPDQSLQRFELGPGQRQRITWWGTVQDVDKVELVFSAKAGSLQDSTRPESGSIPVLHYSSPQTFATTGTLAQKGQRLEAVSLPQSFKPTGGQLLVEVSPSLGATVIQSLQSLKAFPYDFTEAILSRMLPNLEMYRMLQDLNLDSPNLKNDLSAAVTDAIQRLVYLQSADGGWGWSQSEKTDAYITAYVLFGLSRANQSGFMVDPKVIQSAQQYVLGSLITPGMNTEPYLLDRGIFEIYSLRQSNMTVPVIQSYETYQEKMSSWGRALLAVLLELDQQGNPTTRSIISNLESTAVRSATGAHWESQSPEYRNNATPNFETAIVVMALARLDPAAPILTDAVRYLVAHRLPTGCWSSSYESAWVLLSLTETMKGTGDLQANYSYSAEVNQAPLLSGNAGGIDSLQTVTSSVPLSELFADAPNGLLFQRGEGAGRLFYRAFLQVDRPVATAPAFNRGVAVERRYYQDGLDCKAKECTPIDTVSMGSDNPTAVVRVTVTLPHDTYYLVVEDHIPAGAEIVNLQLNTSAKTVKPDSQPGPEYDPVNPFGNGWGWWVFGQPVVRDQSIQWTAPFVPAGTYELTYRITPIQAGEYQVIPAHAGMYYFPEVEGATGGTIFKITP